jgi:hypothetical protein
MLERTPATTCTVLPPLLAEGDALFACLHALPAPLQVGDVTAADISKARAAASQAAPNSPALFSTYLPFAQECYAKGRDKEWFRCPVAQVSRGLSSAAVETEQQQRGSVNGVSAGAPAI